jgi:hypothetical protein
MSSYTNRPMLHAILGYSSAAGLFMCGLFNLVLISCSPP